MEFVWVLIVCGGISGWGCGNFSASPMPDFPTCQTAAAQVHFTTAVGSLSSGEAGRSGYTYCSVKPVEFLSDVGHGGVPEGWSFK